MMKRLKILGLVATAVCVTAMGAGTAGASAATFTAEAYPRDLQGQATGASHRFTLAGAAYVQCSTASFEGSIAGASEAVTLTPTFAGCVNNLGQAATVKANGCSYTFHAGVEVSDPGTFDIGGASCTGIAITYPLCTATVSAQSGIDQVSYSNSGSGTSRAVNVSVQGHSMTYSQSSGCYGGAGTFGNGYYSGSLEVKGFSKEGQQAGFYLLNPPRFEAEKYPVTVSGQQAVANEDLLTVKAGTLRCQTAKLSGELIGPSRSLSLGAEYGGCYTTGVGAASVYMQSCRYVPRVSLASETTATLDIVCAKEGDKITVVMPFCTVTIGPQSGLSGVSLTSTGSGATRTVSMGLQVEGVQYSQTKLCPGGAGAFTDGVLRGTFGLKAFSGATQAGLYIGTST